MSADTATTGLPTATPGDARSRLGQLLRRRWRGVTVLLMLTAASSAAQLAGPALIGRVIDAVTDRNRDARRIVNQSVAAYAVLLVVGAVLMYAAAVLAARLAEDALNELRREVFDSAIALPIDVVEQVGTGELVSRVSGDVQTLTDFTRRALPRLVFAGTEAVLTVVALVLVDVRLAAVAVAATVPVSVVASRWYFRHAPARYRSERERSSALTALLHESYVGATVLRLYGATRRARDRVIDAGSKVVDANMATTAARNRFRSLLQLAQGAALVAVLAVGTALLGRDRVTLGAVSASAIYLTRVMDPVTVVLEQIDLLQRATASLARIVGVSSVPTASGGTPSEHSRPAPPPVAGNAVELVDVAFSYRAGHRVLHDINLSVRRGERLAIVGASGAGKTTLAKLLTGAHHPDAGHIFIDGTPIERYPADQLARTVALVVQEPHTFARSLADNVRLADPTLTDDQVHAALASAGADGWVQHLPYGMRTIVGDGHEPLTPPQQQQLALARVLAAGPDVVILDEATADLDPIAAASTEQHLYATLAGRTVITIAHRLDTVRDADRIAIFDRGRLVAVGTHDALMCNEQIYRELWRTWTEVGRRQPR